MDDLVVAGLCLLCWVSGVAFGWLRWRLPHLTAHSKGGRMSLSSRFKTTFVIWPRRLLDGKQDGPDGQFKKLGWVWLQRAHLTNNSSLGWVAFIEYQTSKYLDHCHVCGKPFSEADHAKGDAA